MRIHLRTKGGARRLPPATWVTLLLGVALCAPGLLWVVPAAQSTSGHSPQARTEAGRPELVLESGHTQGVFSLAFSPEGALLATASTDNTVKLWDVATARGVRTLSAPSEVTAVAFSHDGLRIAAGCGGGQIQTWDVASGRPLAGWSAHEGKVSAVGFGRDGRLASGGVDRAVKLWNAGGGGAGKVGEHQEWVTAVAFSPDAKTLATGGRDRQVKLWDVEKGREGQAHSRHAGPVTALAFSSSGGLLASGAADGGVVLFDVGRKAVAGSLQAGPGKLLALAFGEGDRELTAQASRSAGPRRWDVSSGKALDVAAAAAGAAPQGGAGAAFEAAALGAGGTWLATSDGSNEDEAVILRPLAGGGAARRLTSRAGAVHANAWSHDGKWFASGGRDGAVRLWERATGVAVFTLESDISLVNAVSFSRDGQLVAAGGQSGRIKVWETAGGLHAAEFDAHPGASVNALAFGAEGALASGGNDGRVKLWGAKTGRELIPLGAHAGEVRALAFSPDGRLLASGGSDRSVKVWDAATGAALLTLKTNDGEVKALAFSPDGRSLAAGGGDNTIRVWRVPEGGEAQLLTGHADWVTALAFSPDGGALISGGRDGTLKSWDTAGGRQTSVALVRHAARVSAISFLPKSSLMITSGEDGSSIVCDAASGERLATMISFRGSADWLVVAPDGLFDGSPEAWDQILWRFENRTTYVRPVEVFFSEFYRPGLLADILAGKRPRAEKDIALRDRRQPRVKLSAGGAHHASPPPAAPAAPVDARELIVRVEVEEEGGGATQAAGGGARDVRLFRNGLLVKAWRGDVLSGAVAGCKPAGRGAAVCEAAVPVVAGANELKAYAFNRDSVKSADSELRVTGAEALRRRGTAYILAVGVNEYANSYLNLRYARPDAVSFCEEVSRAQSAAGTYERVEVVPIFDGAATKRNILGAINILSGGAAPGAPPELSKLARSRPEDAIFIFYAGHGTALHNTYYMIPHDPGYAGPAPAGEAERDRVLGSHFISDRELESAMEGIDASQIVFVLDSCNSGQALDAEDSRRGPMNTKGLAQLAYEKGIYVLTAAQSYQAAKEVEELGHGLLTHALIVEGLKGGRADTKPPRGVLLLGEWLDYPTERVPRMQIEKMKKARGLGAELAFVKGEERIADPNDRTLQRPRVFYRRELAPGARLAARSDHAGGKAGAAFAR